MMFMETATQIGKRNVKGSHSLSYSKLKKIMLYNKKICIGEAQKHVEEGRNLRRSFVRHVASYENVLVLTRV